jgi:hypothetical protein
MALQALHAEPTLVGVGVAVRAVGLQSQPSLAIVDTAGRLALRGGAGLAIGTVAVRTLELGVGPLQRPSAASVLKVLRAPVGPFHELEIQTRVFGMALLALALAFPRVETSSLLAQLGDAGVALEAVDFDALALESVATHAVGVALQ